MAEPLCDYFGSCGGCQAQNLDYHIQLLNKASRLASAAGLDSDEVEVFSDEPYFYRNRMDMVFHPGGLGLRRKGSWHRIVDIEKCVIANRRVNELLGEVRAEFADADSFDVRKKSGTFRYAVLRAPGDDSSVSFVLNADSTRLLPAREKIIEFAEGSSAKNIAVTYVPSNTDVSISEDYFTVKGGDELEMEILDKRFGFNVQGFFQNNDRMALGMHEHVRRILKAHDQRGRSLVDLYGGVGTFAVINADLFDRVITIESFPGSVESARRNIAANGTGNVEAVELDARNLGRAGLNGPLTVVTDPPRSGMHPKTVKALMDLRPELLVYVSCNIRQLAVDLKKFEGYRISSAALFDLFPHTPHCEAVVEMVAC